jgi:predicted trehalose synthase
MAKFPAFPAFDLSRLDTAQLNELDDKLVAIARDAAYITIGFSVLAFQKAQVRRRELVGAALKQVRGFLDPAL